MSDNTKIIRYFDLPTESKLTLTTEQFTDAVKAEGLHRGLKPPITLADALKEIGYVGYRVPQDAIKLYEVIRPAQYGSGEKTGLCFRTSEQAHAACVGGIAVHEPGYGTEQGKITEGQWEVREKWVSLRKQVDVASRIEEYQQEDADFDKLAEECSADLSTLRQAKYNREVRACKRTEYLRLANGDQQVASAFWDKTERTAFPDEAGN